MQTVTTKKPFLLTGSYRTHLDIKALNKQAKADYRKRKELVNQSLINKKNELMTACQEEILKIEMAYFNAINAADKAISTNRWF